MKKKIPPLTLFTPLLLLTKKIRISLEFDASGTGFEAFFGGFLLVDTVLNFFLMLYYFRHKEKLIREEKN